MVRQEEHAKMMSRRHILHMLKMQKMSGKQLADTAKECRSDVISSKLVPLMLVKLQEEGLVQPAGNNRFVITTKGIESLKSLDSMSKEFQKIAKIVQNTSRIGKFMITDAIDRVAMISGMDDATSGYSSQMERTSVHDADRQ